MAHEKAAIGNLLYVIPLRNLSRTCSQRHAVHRSFWPSLSDTAAVAQPYRSVEMLGTNGYLDPPIFFQLLRPTPMLSSNKILCKHFLYTHANPPLSNRSPVVVTPDPTGVWRSAVDGLFTWFKVSINRVILFFLVAVAVVALLMDDGLTFMGRRTFYQLTT